MARLVTYELSERIVRACDMIQSDMAEDIHRLEGAPFDGRTVSEMFGKQAAAISALAGMVKELVSGN